MRSMPRAIAASFAMLLLVSISLHGASTFPSDAEIQNELNSRIARGQIVGVVIGILEPDGTRRIITAGASGSSAKLDEHSVFEIGSITKVFTATILSDMVQKEVIALDEPISSYLPSDVAIPMPVGSREITVLDLATHYSGLPRNPSNLKPENPAGPYAGYTLKNLYEFLSTAQLEHEPGKAWAYSNAGVSVLGSILERRSGTNYEALVKERILDPLKMRETSIALTAAMKQRVATGHDELGSPTGMWDISGIPAAGALRSTVHDMLTFAAANFAKNDRPLTKAMRATHAPRRPMRDDQQVGLVWMIAKPKDKTITWHWGGTGGFRSYLGLDLEGRRAVVILANSVQMVNDLGHHLVDPSIPYDRPPADALMIKLVKEKGVPAAIERMTQLKATEADAWTFDEHGFNALGYRFLQEKKTDDAIAVFTLNTKLFPENFNPYDSLAEAYLAKGDRDNAIASYKKSLELNPANENGKEALKKLGVE